MGLRETLRKAAVNAFTACGNIIEPGCSYKEETNQTYTPGSPPTSPVSAQTGLEFLFEDYTDEEKQDRQIHEEAVKASIPGEKFSGTPKRNAQIIRQNPEFPAVWKVQHVGTDPVSALWIMEIIPDSRPEFT